MEDFAVNGKKTAKTRRFYKLSSNQIREIQDMVKGGLSLRKVAKQTNISYSVVHRVASCYAKKQMQLDLSALDERERGYLTGFFVGDGSLFSFRKSGHYGVKFAFDAKRDVEIALFLCNLFAKAGKQTSPYQEDTWLVMKVYSKKLLSFLSGFVSYEEIEGKKRKVLIDLENWSHQFRIGVLSGLIDSDGHVHRKERRSGHFGADITTTNQILANQLVGLCGSLGLLSKVSEINPGKTSFSKRPTYIVRISKPEFSKICSYLNSMKHKQTGCIAKYF